MRIAIIGAGAIGSALGALLLQAGHGVTLVARPDHVAAIRSAGLQVEGCLGKFVVHPDATERLDNTPELALITTKTQDVLEAVSTNSESLGDIPVIAIQNGIRAADLVAQILPREQVLSGVTVMVATYLTPGQVALLLRGSLVIGRPWGPPDEQTHELARLLDAAFPTKVTGNIRGAHWTKLIINLNNALAALTNVDVTGLLADPRLPQSSIGLMREGVSVADHAGISLGDLPELSAGQLRLSTHLPIGVAAWLAAQKARSFHFAGPAWGSTLQSLKRGKPTEVDYLNGEVVRLGRELGVPTPLNARVVELVHELEGTGRYFAPGDLANLLSRRQPRPVAGLP
jgi:2-dehydropantoate 2-reductase